MAFEAKQLLHLMIHFVLQQRIFLRECIQCLGCADKLRYEALTDSALYEDDGELRIEFDKEAKIISIIDNGIGMTRDEAIEHLGTIAKSGTAQFLSGLVRERIHS